MLDLCIYPEEPRIVQSSNAVYRVPIDAVVTVTLYISVFGPEYQILLLIDQTTCLQMCVCIGMYRHTHRHARMHRVL